MIVKETIVTRTETGVRVQETITLWSGDRLVAQSAPRTWVKESPPVECELDETERKPGEDKQPNPEGDSGGFGFLDRDPWEAFLAWYTGQLRSPLKNPYDDDPGGDPTESGYGGASAAPRVGIEAVINPVDPLWGSSPGGGSGVGPTLPGCVFPVGPPRS
jgi:hypothetical protein